MASEFSEGEYYDDFLLPGNDPDEKDCVRELFDRLEVKMPISKGLDVRARKEKPYVYQEFPHAMFHRKLGDKIVNNVEEKQAALKEGWQLIPFPKKELLAAQIVAAEEVVARLVLEFEQLTGLDYEDELAKQEAKEKKIK